MFSSIRFCFISPPRLSYISDSSEQYDDHSDSDHVISLEYLMHFIAFTVCTSWILSAFIKRRDKVTIGHLLLWNMNRKS